MATALDLARHSHHPFAQSVYLRFEIDSTDESGIFNSGLKFGEANDSCGKATIRFWVGVTARSNLNYSAKYFGYSDFMR
ncbi:hypothetical protein QUA41_25290 [Microcoleus sp. Pol11C1]|uniref:hypothetical protein n=1 Tax=unclassified Microcoleus TaxID=2642155 RepID=UPI002FD52F50